MNRIQQTVLAMMLSASLSLAWAHGDDAHDHDDAKPSPALSAAPAEGAARASTASESFEMVVELSPDEAKPSLMLYIDRFATNEALRGATIEVESGTFKGIAKAVAPGVYQLPGQAFSAHGQYPLTVSIQAGDDADLLNVVLDTRHHDDAPHPANVPPFTWAWAVAAIVASAAIGLFIRRRWAARPHTSQDLT